MPMRIRVPIGHKPGDFVDGHTPACPAFAAEKSDLLALPPMYRSNHPIRRSGCWPNMVIGVGSTSRSTAAAVGGELPLVAGRRLNELVTAMIRPGLNPYSYQASVGDEGHAWRWLK